MNFDCKRTPDALDIARTVISSGVASRLARSRTNTARDGRRKAPHHMLFVGCGLPSRVKSSQHTRTVNRDVVPDAMSLKGFPRLPISETISVHDWRRLAI